MSGTMSGKTVLITGGTGGIGKATATGLARMGATVAVVGRDRTRGVAAVEDIKRASGNERIDLLLADLERQAEIRRLADKVSAHYARLDVLINNVGGLYPTRRLTEDGIEATLAVNHLAPFLLTHLLLDLLTASRPARVINVTGGFPGVRLDLANLQAERSYLGLSTYSHAKVVMMVAAYEFAQRLAGTGVTLNVAYPGAAATAMTAGMTPAMVPVWMRLIWPAFGLIMRNARPERNAQPERAARSSIYLASSPEVADVSGAYFNTNSRRARWPKAVYDDALRQQIWAVSQELTGLAASVPRVGGAAGLRPARV